jgi:hypothetical protein
MKTVRETSRLPIAFDAELTMMARRKLWSALIVTVFGFDLPAAVRLTAGEEIPLSTLARALPEAARSAPVMATDGDTILSVYTRGGAIFATRFDRDGRLLTPEPLPILQRIVTDGVAVWDTALRLLWFRDHYVLFFRAPDSSVRAIRITPAGIPVEVVALPLQTIRPIDVATDGNEIILVCDVPTAFRLDASLQLIGTLPLAPTPLNYQSAVRSIAYGDGRFMILTLEWSRVSTEVVQDGAVSPRVDVGPVNRESRPGSKVVWTGSTFVAGWSECTQGISSDACLGVWTPLTSTGAAAGLLRITGYALLSTTSPGDFELSLTALDRDTVWFTWRAGNDQTRVGRTYRLNGAAMGPTTKLGFDPVSSLTLPGDALAIIDARQRLAWIDAAETATLPEVLPFQTTLLIPPNETVLDAAASTTEIAVLRSVKRDDETVRTAAVSILAHDGTLLRDIDLGEDVSMGTIASDGRQFFALLWHWRGAMTFHNLTTGKDTAVWPSGAYPSMVWTGTELVAAWRAGGEVTIARFDREGRPLALPTALARSDRAAHLVARDGRVLLAYTSGGVTHVQVLDSHGYPVGGPDTVKHGPGWWRGAIATNGETEVVPTSESNRPSIGFAFRPRNGTFVQAAGRVTAAQPIEYASLAATAQGFLFAYQVPALFDTSHLALIDDQGFATRTLDVGSGIDGEHVLVELAPDRLLYVYPRIADDSRRAGASRVYGRIITVTNEDGSRNGPSSQRIR